MIKRMYIKFVTPLRSGFVRSVTILTGGTVFAQGLMAVSLPFLTRLYAPENFSFLAVYVAIVGIVVAVSCLRLNITVPLPKSDGDGMALVILSILAATVVSCFLAVPVVFAPLFVAKLIGQPTMAPLLWMIPVGCWVASVYTALQYWASRQKRFGLITRTRVTRAVGGTGTQLGIGLTAPGPFGLMFGHMIYGGLGIAGLAKSIWTHDREALGAVSFRNMRHMLWAYRRFQIWSVPEALFNTIGVQVPVIIIAAMAVGPEAAFVMLAMRVIGLPAGLVGASVAQVYLAEAPHKLRNGTLGLFTRETMIALLKAGAPPLLLVGAASPFVFGIIFGTEWERAGILVAWMTPWFILQFVTSPVSMVLHVNGELRFAMLLQAAGLVLRLGAVLGAIIWAPNWTGEAYAVSGFLFYGGYLIVMLVHTARINPDRLQSA